MQIRRLFAFFASAVVLGGLPAPAMSTKPKVSVRFYTEANAQIGSTFAMPARLENMGRDTHLNRVPEFSELQITAIYPFPATDGTWGCAFQLSEQGRIRLETLSTESRGTALVVVIGTKKGQHQVTDMMIDRPVTDGVITVPKGITEIEIAGMRKQFKVLGVEKEKPVKVKKDDGTDWGIDRSRPVAPTTPPSRHRTMRDLPALPADAASVRRRASEMDLPRLAD